MEKKGHYYELVMSNHSAPPPSIRDSHKVSLRNSRNSIRLSHRFSRLSFISELDDLSEDDIDGDDDERELDENTRLLGTTTKPKKQSTFLRILKLNGKEWPYITSGIIGSFLVGVAFPVFALVFGEIYGILSTPDLAFIRAQANMFSIYFLILGIAAGIGAFLQAYMFTYAGVFLTSRLRSMTFKSMMKQEMAWFDDDKNAVGALCARLAGDCAAVQGATGAPIGGIIQAIATVITGLTLSFIYSWKLTLVASTCFPAVIIAVFVESRMMEKSELEESAAIENATRMAVEAISNIRTVASLNQEIPVYNRYSHEIDKVHKLCARKGRFRGLVFGIGQAIPLMGYALSLWYGGYLVANKEIDYKNVIK
jgi:ATP-binding cassette subfamily B (MDR/TAP) protein 1